MENSAIHEFFSIRFGDSVAMPILMADDLSIIVEIEWEISRLSVSVNFSKGVTVPVVFHFDGGSTKSVIAFVVLSGIVNASSVMIGCCFTVVSLEGVLTCNVKCGKCMRPCVVSMTTLLLPIKCNPIIGPANLFITTKISANILSPISILRAVGAKGFSDRPFATCIWKLGGWSILRKLFGVFYFIVSKSF